MLTFSGSAGTAARRRRRGHAEDIFKNPLAANDRRGASGVGGNGENAALAEQAAASAVLAEVDSPEAAAIDVGDAVVLGEAAIDDRCSWR